MYTNFQTECNPNLQPPQKSSIKFPRTVSSTQQEEFIIVRPDPLNLLEQLVLHSSTVLLLPRTPLSTHTVYLVYKYHTLSILCVTTWNCGVEN